MKKSFLVIAFVLISGLVLAACQPTPPLETPPVDNDYVYGHEAFIESVEIIVGNDGQVQAVVSGNLPDGCTKLHEITVEQEAQEFVLSIVTRREQDVVCTMALVPFEETVDLDVEDLEPGTYTVIAQDQEATFSIEEDREIRVRISQEDFILGRRATVESMDIFIMESFPVQVSVSLVGYFPDACPEIHEIVVNREDQTFMIEIFTREPAGDVMCAQVITPFEENVDLDVVDLPAGEYTVQVNDLSETFTLEVDNTLEE